MNKFDITPLPPIPRFSQFRNCSLMEDVREMRVREGQVEVVTLLVETNMPRRRTLSESYEHVCPPIGEHPRARRKRLKAESSARSRAMLRLHPGTHAQHLQKLKEKRDAGTVSNASRGQAACCKIGLQIGSGTRWNGRRRQHCQSSRAFGRWR